MKRRPLVRTLLVGSALSLTHCAPSCGSESEPGNNRGVESGVKFNPPMDEMSPSEKARVKPAEKKAVLEPGAEDASVELSAPDAGPR